MNVDLRRLKTEIQKEMLKIAEREEILLSQLSNVQRLVGFLEENQPIQQNCAVGSDGQLTQDDSNDSPRSESRKAGIRVCPRCDVKVLPTMDGRCPSCQNQFPRQ